MKKLIFLLVLATTLTMAVPVFALDIQGGHNHSHESSDEHQNMTPEIENGHGTSDGSHGTETEGHGTNTIKKNYSVLYLFLILNLLVIAVAAYLKVFHKRMAVS